MTETIAAKTPSRRAMLIAGLTAGVGGASLPAAAEYRKIGDRIHRARESHGEAIQPHLSDPAISGAADFIRTWGACILEDEDAAGHAAWADKMAEVEAALAEIVPTTVEGALALLGVVRFRAQGGADGEFDDILLGNLEVGLRSLSAA